MSRFSGIQNSLGLETFASTSIRLEPKGDSRNNVRNIHFNFGSGATHIDTATTRNEKNTGVAEGQENEQ